MTTTQDMLALLESGDVIQFNIQRVEFPNLDFFGADLSNKDLSSADLANVNFRKSDFSNSDLTGAILTNSFFNDSDFSETIIEDVDAENSQWCQAFIEKTSFQRSNLHKANFNGADLNNVDFSFATLSETQFKKSNQKSNLYVSTNLVQSKFSQSKMEECQFEDVNLNDSKFPLANLQNSKFLNSEMQNCNFALTQIANCQFEGNEAVKINFDQAKLNFVHFKDSNISEGNFLTKECEDCQFENVNEHAVIRSFSNDEKAINIKCPPFPQYLFHQAIKMAAGHGKICITWENFEGEGTLICYAIYSFDTNADAIMGTLPVSSKFLRSRNLIACPEGFLSVCLEQRNARDILAFHTITPRGVLLSSTYQHLAYNPISTLCVVPTGAGALIYGVSNKDPRIRVTFIGYNGKNKNFTFQAPNAQKLIGEQSPIATRISGSMFEITHKGLKKDILGSHGFPGSKASAEARKDVLAYAWIEPDTMNLWGCINNDSPRLLSRALTIRSIRIGFSKTNPWAVILVSNPDFSTFLVASSIDGSHQIPLTGDQSALDILVEEVHCLSTKDGLYISLSDQDGQFYVFHIAEQTAELVIKSKP